MEFAPLGHFGRCIGGKRGCLARRFSPLGAAVPHDRDLSWAVGFVLV